MFEFGAASGRDNKPGGDLPLPRPRPRRFIRAMNVVSQEGDHRPRFRLTGEGQWTAQEKQAGLCRVGVVTSSLGGPPLLPCFYYVISRFFI